MTEQSTRTKKKQRIDSGFATRAIHGAEIPDPTTGAITTPIYQTTTYAQKAVGVDKGYTYSRSGNPTVQVLEDSLAILEKGVGAACFGTGMSAITAVFSLLSQGDHAVIAKVVYGGTPRLCDNILARFGLNFTYVDTSDIEAVGDAVTEKTKLVFVETPANPTLKLTDVRSISEIKKNAKLVVDNTFLSPALQVPIDLGADITLHSTTKYIEGHNSTVGGGVIFKNKKDYDDVKYLQNAMGLIQSPFNAWLTIRGLKTLDVRMKRHCENAEILAEYLEGHPKVTKVLYPGLDSFSQASLARRQHLRGHGGMLSFELKGGVKAGLKFAGSLSLITLAESLGAVETMVTHPATMTHAAMGKKARLEAGITDGLIRLSVGLEDPDDLIADLDQAIKRAVA